MKTKRCLAVLLAIVLLSNLAITVNLVYGASTITFTGEELLGKPTNTSITINIVPASTIEYHYQYGTSSGSYTMQTSNSTATGGQPHEVTITGLNPDTQYFYRMRYHAPGDSMSDWVNRTEHSFWTQRAEGSTFTFTVTSDSHENFNTAEQNAMTNILNEHPDFEIDLGDTFLLDGTTSQNAVNNKYLAYREPLYFDKIGSSSPIFLASGNHEDEEGWNLDDSPFSIALASIQARKLYFPTPISDGFYSANTNILAAISAATYGDQYREDYYAWTWGDALFVVIDEFQYTMSNPYGSAAGEGSDDPASGDQWNWTLGTQQFNWLKQTLQNSDAKYKFIFSHNMLGGIPRNIAGVNAGYVRGGAEAAAYFEWGGNNADGSAGFATHRTAADFGTEPVHQLMVDYGVSAYFHGHDHQYAYETRDGIVYQEVPSPGMSGSGFSGIYTEGDHGAYNTVRVMPNSGHLKITVSPTQATVDYISSSSTSGTVNYSYTIEPEEAPTDPNISVTGVPLTAFTSTPGTPSTAQDFTVSGSNLTNNIIITPPGDFQVSLSSGSGWTSSPLTITQSGGSVPATTVYARFNRATAGTSSGNITLTSNGAATRNVAVSGTATDATPITFTGTELLGRPEANSISISIVPNADISLYYEYSTTSGGPYTNTSTVSASNGTPKVVVINGLTAGTTYYYRMKYSSDGGTSWVTRPEHSFQTQRAQGSTFTFDVTSDAHVNIMLGNSSNWTSTLNGIASDAPDFLIDLGDTFAMDNGTTSVTLGDTAAAEQKYKDALAYFNIVSASTPIFLVSGNHEQQEAWHLQGTLANSLPIMGKNAEKKFYLNPGVDSFYSGDTSTQAELSGDHLKQDYYAWTWGDALFVVISPFWTTTTKPYTTTVGGGETDATGSGNRWDWTLGQTQFNWLKTTLQNSNVKYKFVFAHQIVGGNGMTSPNQVNYGHGGVDSANLVEWGGYDVGGTNYTWDTNRSGWGSQPIRQMLEANGVTAFFHGHDHQFAYESLNGMVYQAVPSASFSGSFGNFVTGGNSGNTIWADSSQGPGRLKVTVSPTETTVDFIRYNASSSAYSYSMEPAETPEGAATRVVTSAPNAVNPGDNVNITAAVYQLPGSNKVTTAGLPIVFNYVFYPLQSGGSQPGTATVNTDAQGNAVLQLTAPMEKSVILVDAVFNGSSNLLASSNMQIISAIPIIRATLTAASTNGAVTFHLADQFGNPLSGRTITFLTTSGSLSAGSGVTNASGDVTVTLSGTTSGVVSGSFGGYIDAQGWAYQPTMTRIGVQP